MKCSSFLFTVDHSLCHGKISITSEHNITMHVRYGKTEISALSYSSSWYIQITYSCLQQVLHGQHTLRHICGIVMLNRTDLLIVVVIRNLCG
jgi:hypothetical protein